LVDADKMTESAETAQVKADRLRLDAADYKNKAEGKTTEMSELDEKIRKLTSENNQFGWLPFSSIPADLEAAKAGWAKLNKDKQALFKSREEALAAADKEAAAAEAQRKDAVAKRSTALKTKSAEEAAVVAREIMAAGEVMAEAEEAFASGGKAAALKVLSAGSSALQAINLKADARASPSSMPGRLHALLSPPAAQQASKAASTPASASSFDLGGFFGSLFGAGDQGGSDSTAPATGKERVGFRSSVKRRLGSLGGRLGSLGGKYESRDRLGQTKVPK